MDDNLDQNSIEGCQLKSNKEAFLINEFLKELRPQLPIQNPMPFFVHNNPIQYWEKYKFKQGVESACLLYERAGIQIDRNFAREFEDLVIPILASYLDQGMRRWTSHDHLGTTGLWGWFKSFVVYSSSFKSEVFADIKRDFNLWSEQSSEEYIRTALVKKFKTLDNTSEWHFYLKSLLFHLKGWSGMVHLFESNPSLYPLKEKKISLVDWLAILVLVESKLSAVDQLPIEVDPKLRHQRGREIQLEIADIKNNEDQFYRTIITDFRDQIKINRNLKNQTPVAQIFFCIDDREETLRKMIEKINPQIETFGTVGFFGIDIAIRSLDQLIFQPFCPPVIQPRKKATELTIHQVSRLENKVKSAVTAFNHTRFTVLEPLIALLAPFFYLATLLIRTLNLGFYGWLRNKFLNQPNRIDDLKYEFEDGFSYSLAEKVKIVKDILKSAGLKENFSQVIIMMGHGASTTNNPFQKSYGCGACSGQSGFANAKIFCSFANDVYVRKSLAELEYHIPESTMFIAGHHDTCSDEFMLVEDKNMSVSQKTILNNIRIDLKRSLQKNTEDRFNRFGIDLSESPVDRSLDWSQPRPEYGHSRVAMAVFGPRWLTGNMNLSGRSFLVSYDPRNDLNGAELEFVIMNALPVCANINLDYFTSRAFPEAFGSGSKLPMNIVSGIGLMTGSKGDLRIGLARQMVDRHEALRLISFVFCKKEHLVSIIGKSARLTNLVKNEWIHLVRIDPDDFSMEPFTEHISVILNDKLTEEFSVGIS